MWIDCRCFFGTMSSYWIFSSTLPLSKKLISKKEVSYKEGNVCAWILDEQKWKRLQGVCYSVHERHKNQFLSKLINKSSLPVFWIYFVYDKLFSLQILTNYLLYILNAFIWLFCFLPYFWATLTQIPMFSYTLTHVTFLYQK